MPLNPESKWSFESPLKVETWQNALEVAGPLYVQMRLLEDLQAKELVFGARRALVPRDFATEWLAEKLGEEKTAQAEREKRMVDAANGARWAARWAAIAAIASALGPIVQAIVAW